MLFLFFWCKHPLVWASGRLSHEKTESCPQIPDSRNAGVAPHPHQQDYRDTNYQQEARSTIVVPLSFHRSQNEPGLYQTQSRHQLNQPSMERYQFHQAQHSLKKGKQQPMQPSPMPTSRSIRSTQKGRMAPIPPPVQIPSTSSETPNRRLRLSLEWDTTPVNLWLDLDIFAEVFFQALRDVSKRRQVHNWNLWVIWLKTELQLPEDSTYRLTLGEDLDADWDITVDRLEQNKRDKPPHICGLFEVRCNDKSIRPGMVTLEQN